MTARTTARMIARLVLPLGLLFALFVLPAVGQALTPGSAAEPQNDLGAAIEALEAGGNTVLVVPQPSRTEVAPPTETIGSKVAGRVRAVREKFDQVLANAPNAPVQIVNALRRAGGGSMDWLLPAALMTVISLTVGYVARTVTGRAAGRITGAIGGAPLETRAGKIGHTLAVLVRHAAATGAFFLVGSLAVFVIEPSLSPEQVTALMVISSVSVFFIAMGILRGVLQPFDKVGRVFPLSDELARSLYYQLLIMAAVANIVAMVCLWLAYFPLVGLTHQLLLIISPTASVLLFFGVIFAHRKELSETIRGASVRPGRIRRAFAASWLPLTVIYLIIAWALTVEGVMLDQTLAIGPVLAPFVALVATLFVGGMLIILYDRVLASDVAAPAWGALYEETALGLAWIAGAVTLAAIWRVFERPWADAVITAIGIAVLLVLANAAWRAVQLYVALRLEEDSAAAPATAGEGEGFGPGGTRLGTLLPIVRNVTLFVIASVVVMVLLASLGVNVAPLFAGAGVAGLAIGFGAQALIRDIFSGAFFLLDDAFRKGEYIEVSGIAGMVEKISVRSFQLRHHNGPLHTIPFGEIKQLTNFSRDWVIMKLPVRLTYDTDVEKVRKLVKKLGQEMAAHPEYGHLFLDPPKSQGVIQMEDSAMIIRIKFMTKPGDQFILRKHVYAKVQDVFAKNDIHFAHREVTVRVAGNDDPSPQQAAIAAGAAQAAADATKSKAPADLPM